MSQTKQQVIAEFTKLLEEFERGRLWGSIEVNFSAGALNFIRKITTHRYRTNGEQNEQKEYR